MSWRDHVLRDERALRSIIRPPGVSGDKVLDHIDEHCRRFIDHTTFVLVSTSSLDGRADISPKGDPAGFLRVLDDRTLAIPERPGNGRIDTYVNVVENPAVGLLLLVPGIRETCRISGRGYPSVDPDLLASMAVKDRLPRMALVVEVEEAFVHCGKAVRRGRLWDRDQQIDPSLFPTMGAMLFDHARPGSLSRQELVEAAARDLAENMY